MYLTNVCIVIGRACFVTFVYVVLDQSGVCFITALVPMSMYQMTSGGSCLGAYSADIGHRSWTCNNLLPLGAKKLQLLKLILLLKVVLKEQLSWFNKAI